MRFGERVTGTGAASIVALALMLAPQRGGSLAQVASSEPPATSAPASQPEPKTQAPPKGDEEDEVVKLGAARGYRLGDLEWEPGPFPGSRIAFLAGDPKTGMHHSFLKLADGTAIPPHWHSFDEYVTIVSGTLLFGVGEHADREATRLFAPGGFLWIPANFHYVNPEDDPAKGVKPAPAEGK
jgi:hypothetical protein